RRPRGLGARLAGGLLRLALVELREPVGRAAAVARLPRPLRAAGWPPRAQVGEAVLGWVGRVLRHRSVAAPGGGSGAAGGRAGAAVSAAPSSRRRRRQARRGPRPPPAAGRGRA